MRGGRVVVPSPDIEFFDHQGIKHLFESTCGTSWSQWPVGSEVDVEYDPNDPANCELSLSRTTLVMLAIPFGVFTIVGGSFAIATLYQAIQSALR
jgi:hypothetical protein